LAGPGVQSGIYEKGLTDFAQQNFRDMADFNSEQDMEMQRSRYEQAQAKAEYDQQIAELEAQKQASIANAAATLAAFKPFLK
jgi:glycine cleavage system H lipoate-binding protein